jgi:agmatinase
MRDPFFGLTRSSSPDTLVVVGIPWDLTSSYRRGASGGPNAIRMGTDGALYNRYSERGIDLADVWRVCDHGNIRKVKAASKLRRSIEVTTRLHHHRDQRTLFLGGDHYVTYPAFELIAESEGKPLSLLYFDAHPDLYPSYEGSLHSHATVVSRIVENPKTSTGRVCYVGIRASTKEQDQRIQQFGLTKFTSDDVYRKGCEAISSSVKKLLTDHLVYLSIDLDCLDPAYAPGVANPQPAGLSTRQLFDILRGLDGLKVVAADIVEYSPNCESNARTTGFTAAVLIKEIMQLLSSTRRS